MNEQSQLPGYIAGFLFFVSAASGVAVLVKAWMDNMPEATSKILWNVFIFAACAGLLLNPGASHGEQIFLALLGAFSGLSLVVRAVLNIAHKAGSATMVSLFIVSLGATLILYFWPRLLELAHTLPTTK